MRILRAKISMICPRSHISQMAEVRFNAKSYHSKSSTLTTVHSVLVLRIHTMSRNWDPKRLFVQDYIDSFCQHHDSKSRSSPGYSIFPWFLWHCSLFHLLFWLLLLSLYLKILILLVINYVVSPKALSFLISSCSLSWSFHQFSWSSL